MLSPRWSKWVKTMVFTRNDRNARRRKHCPPHRLLLEHLEDRTLPSVTATPAPGGGQIITATGAPGDDTYIIGLDPTGQTVQIWENAPTTDPPTFTAPSSAVVEIDVNGMGGDDRLIVDSSNGLIDAPNGIHYDGGGGSNSLDLTQSGGATQTSDDYKPGPNLGEGTDVITGPGGVQTVAFQNLAPVRDNVPAATATVSGTPADDVFNYTQGPGGGIFVGNTGLVTVNNLESYEFNNKMSLALNGLAGSDAFNLNNTTTPAGLTGLSVNADATTNLTGAVGPVTVFIGDNTPNSPNPNTVITGYGAPVTLIGIDTANLDVNGQSLTATPTKQNDNIIYTPTGATSGTFYDDVGSGNNLVPNTVFNVTNVAGNFMVFNDPGGNADQVTIRATAARDLIQIDQGTGVAQVLANNVTPLLPVELGISAEILNAVGVGGENTFQVIPAPGIAGQAQDNLLINIDGGASGANNAVVVAASFAGVGGATAPLAANQFVVVNRGRTPDTGTVRVFTAAVADPDINYKNVQVIAPHASGSSLNPNLLDMGPDLNEPNDQQGNAAFLGSGATLQVQHATIFPNNTEFPGVPADNDFYRVVAQTTGTLDFQVFFRTFNTALLPGGGQLNLQAFDASGNVIASAPGVFGADPGTGNARIRIPAVAGQSYFLRVFGATAAVVNGYDATIIDTPPPTPFNLELSRSVLTATVTNPGAGYTSAPQVQITGGGGAGAVGTAYVANGQVIAVTIQGGAGYTSAPTLTLVGGGGAGATATAAIADTGDLPPNAPNDDTGRSQLDNVTTVNTPVIFLRLNDGIFLNDLPGNGVPDNPPAGVIPIPFSPNATTPGYRVALFDGNNTQTPIAFATPVGAGFPGLYQVVVTTPLADGLHHLTAAVQMVDPANPTETGFGAVSAPVDVVVDTLPPPVFFGTAENNQDGLDAGSDSGIVGDGITNVTNPTFYGAAEADAVIRVFAVATNPNSPLFGQDVLIGQTVATPLDGANAFPGGRWVVQSNVNLNDPAFFTFDGTRTIHVTAEDLAGNVSAPQTLDIRIDTGGNVVVTGGSGDDTLVLTRTPGGGDGDITYVLNGGAPVTLTNVHSFTFNGLGGNDTLVVDSVNGEPLIAGGVTNDGGTGFNTLTNDAAGLPVRTQPGTVSTGDPVTVSYSNTQATLLNNAAAVVAIAGPDTADRATAFAGLNAQERAVQALYLDALGRAGSQAELDGWVAALPAGATSLTPAVVAGVEHSAEARDNLVRSWYVAFLGRQAQGGEEQPWVNALLAGQTEEQILSGILGSAEFYARAQALVSAGSADERFVQALYQLLLNRAGGAAEVAGWVGALPSIGRQGAALGFLQSQEFRTDQFEGYYNALLRRPGDQAGLQGWVFSNLDMDAVRIAFESTAEFFVDG